MATIIQVRHDTAANWTSANPILALGEFGLETDTNKLKRGDGTTSWNNLSYFGSGGAVQSVNGQTGVVVLDAQDVGALPDNTVIPTKTSDLDNDSGFITGIDSTDVTTALGYTPYSDANPSGYQDATDVNSAIEAKITNSVQSTSTSNALSANMGKELQDQITHLQGIGRFLSLWNATTGLAETNPPVSPYTYKTGDYFIVGNVATGNGTNYKPSGSSYTTGVASSTVETETIDVGNVYYYDGTTWKLQAGGGGGTITDVLVNGTSVVSVGVANVTVPTRTSVTDTTSTTITLANANANTDYHYGTLTSLTVTANDTSDLETTIYFTAGNTITVSLPASLDYIGSAPVFEPNTTYAISILNNILVAGAVA